MANMLDLLEGLPCWEWPENAGDAVKRALEKGDSDERIRAATLAGELVVMDDELAGLLLGIVEDRNAEPELRARAAIACGPALEDGDLVGYDDDLDPGFDARVLSEGAFRRVCQALRRVYEDSKAPSDVRRACLEAAVRAPQDWHAKAVEQARASSAHDWQVTAVFCMGHLPGFDDALLEALQSADPDLLREAVRAAGLRGLDPAGPRLRALAEASDTDRATRLEAISALAYVPSEPAEELLTSLTRSSDLELAEAAQEALSELRAMHLDPEDGDPAN